MLRHRCPWCGEKLPIKFFRPSDPISIIADEGEIDTCPHCYKLHKSSSNLILVSVLVGIFIGVEIFSFLLRFRGIPIVFEASIVLFLLGLFCIIGTIIGYYRIPYKRDYRTERSKRKGIYISAISIIVVRFITIFIFHVESNPVITWGMVVAAFICMLLIVYLTYCFTYNRNTENESVVRKHTAQTVITWENHQQGGLMLPRFRIIRGEIFPACFMDEQGTPISTPLCIVLEQLHWKDQHHCTCTIQLVLDDVPDELLFQPNKRFFLYCDRRKVATGLIQ